MQFDTEVCVLIWTVIVNLFTLVGALIGFYLILQKFHMRIQMRFLKNISDEIIKINDFCIEFSFKYIQYLEILALETAGTDPKTLAEIQVIRSKIKNHLDYLSAQINSFPFGNPLNFFWYSITEKYLWENIQIITDELLTNYQDAILNDTILQTEMSINPSIDKNESYGSLIDQERIDSIVVSGLDLINHLEDHSKKLY